ncbi:MAG: rod shape-determining protein MreD [Bacteroidaceae bacterium]|nr:rod shape-determining protein MreD [Bacteroidaceae bacterium]
MIVSTLKRLFWALILLAAQVLILDQVHPWGYGAPLICSLIVITLPMGTSRSAALLWGFGVGFVADIFAGTAGISSAALTFIALIQPPLLGLMAPRDSEEELHPSFSTMGRWNYLQFIALLLLLHHLVYFALEGFSYFHIIDIAISMGVSYAASLLLIILIEHVRNPQK